MNEQLCRYEDTGWVEGKPRMWWRVLKSLLILSIPLGIIALAAVPLAQS